MMNTDYLAKFETFLREDQVLTSEEDLNVYGYDGTAMLHQMPSCVVRRVTSISFRPSCESPPSRLRPTSKMVLIRLRCKLNLREAVVYGIVLCAMVCCPSKWFFSSTEFTCHG